EAIDDALAFCHEHTLQSDERFARSRARMRASGRSNTAIARELARHQLEPELIEEGMAQLEDEAQRAMALAERHAKDLESQAGRLRTWRYLMARGFSSDLVGRTLRELREQRAQDKTG